MISKFLPNKKCEVCGEVFSPAHKRSRICANSDCRRIDTMRYQKAYRGLLKPHLRVRNGSVKQRKCASKAICQCCGQEFMGRTSASRWCQKPECQRVKYERNLKLSRESNRKRRLLFGPRPSTSSTVGKSLEKATLMEKILENWIDTIFTEREQVELIFLESSHLRGAHDYCASEAVFYAGGHPYTGIFPNRGGRAT